MKIGKLVFLGMIIFLPLQGMVQTDIREQKLDFLPVLSEKTALLAKNQKPCIVINSTINAEQEDLEQRTVEEIDYHARGRVLECVCMLTGICVSTSIVAVAGGGLGTFAVIKWLGY